MTALADYPSWSYISEDIRRVVAYLPPAVILEPYCGYVLVAVDPTWFILVGEHTDYPPAGVLDYVLPDWRDLSCETEDDGAIDIVHFRTVPLIWEEIPL